MKYHVMPEATARWLEFVKEHSITQQQIADACGVSVATARRWRSVASDLKPTITQAYQLYLQWDISPTWIAYGIGPRTLSELEEWTLIVRRTKDVAIYTQRAERMAYALGEIEQSIANLKSK